MYPRAQPHRPPARGKPAWPLVAMLASWPTTFILFIGMADAGFAHKGGFGGWAAGFVLGLIASIVFTRMVAKP